jgi:hypothetical protein
VAYGILHDASSPGWRRQVQATSDLGQMLMTASAVQPAENVVAAAARYRGDELRAAEEKREQQSAGPSMRGAPRPFQERHGLFLELQGQGRMGQP